MLPGEPPFREPSRPSMPMQINAQGGVYITYLMVLRCIWICRHETQGCLAPEGLVHRNRVINCEITITYTHPTLQMVDFLHRFWIELCLTFPDYGASLGKCPKGLSLCTLGHFFSLPLWTPSSTLFFSPFVSLASCCGHHVVTLADFLACGETRLHLSTNRW